MYGINARKNIRTFCTIQPNIKENVMKQIQIQNEG